MTVRRRPPAPARPCPGCGRPVTWRSTPWCAPGCRAKFYADHPTLPTTAPGPEAVAAHQRLVVAIEIRFSRAKLACRRASQFSIDGWAQRPGAGRAMEDWGHEK